MTTQNTPSRRLIECPRCKETIDLNEGCENCGWGIENENETADPDYYKNYHVDDLRSIFDEACDPDDWRAPIAVLVAGEGVLPTIAAIEFFTATTPKISLDTNQMRYLIESEGYRNGPAGP